MDASKIKEDLEACKINSKTKKVEGCHGRGIWCGSYGKCIC